MPQRPKRRDSPSASPSPASATNRRAAGKRIGGSAGAGGYDFQAHAIAFISAAILARRPLKWVSVLRDVPHAVLAETGRSGDDIRIELVGSDDTIEAQAKQGLNGFKKLCEAIDGLVSDSTNEANEYGVLIVDTNASREIKTGLMRDLERLRGGRTDLSPFTQQVVGHIRARNAESFLGRLYVVSLALLERHDGSREQAIIALENWLGNSEVAERAWLVLLDNGRRLIRERGRSDRAALERLLVREGISLPQLATTSDTAMAISQTTLHGLQVSAGSMPVFSAPGKEVYGAEDRDWHARIDVARDMLSRRSPQAALAVLVDVEHALEVAASAGHSPTSPSELRRRILGNRSNALAQLGRLEEASAVISDAIEHDPTDTILRLIGARVAAMSSRRSEAIAHAELVLAYNAENADAWAFVVELGAARLPVPEQAPRPSGDHQKPVWEAGLPLPSERTPPVQLWVDPSLLRAAGVAALSAKRYDEASTFLHAAIHSGQHELEAALLLAGLLLRIPEANGSVSALGGPSEVDALEAERLASDIIEQLGELTYSQFTEQVLLLRANARRLLRRVDAALDDAQRALALHPAMSPDRWRPLYLVAALLLDADRGEEADQLLGQLDRFDESLQPAVIQVAFLLMRARRMAGIGNRSAVEKLIRHAIELADGESFTTDDARHQPQSSSAEVRAAALGSVIEVGALALGEEILDGLSAHSIGWPYQLLLARLRLAQGAQDAAWLAFFAAVEGARLLDDKAARRVQLEHAFARQEAGEHLEAIALFDAAGVWEHFPLARPRYISALLEAHEEGRAQSFLESLVAEGPLPLWALSGMAAISEAANDLPAACSALEELWRQRPENIVTGLRLATVYGRLNVIDRALPVLRLLSQRPGLSAPERMHLALRLSGVGETTDALRQAFHAARLAPDDPEIASAYLSLMLRQGQNEDIPTRLFVGPDSVVRLVPTRRGGRPDEAMTFTILAEPPVDSRRLEFLVSDKRVAQLLNRKVGEVVTFRRGEPSEVSYRVDRVEHAFTAMAQELFRTFPERFPESSAIQRFSVETDPSVTSLMPVVAELHRQADVIDRLLTLYDEQRPPIELLARALGRDIPNVCEILSHRPRPYWVEWGDESRRGAARDAAASPVFVLTRTALWTAQRLDSQGTPMLEIAACICQSLLAPQSLLDMLVDEHRTLEQWRGKDQDFLAAGPAGIAMERRPADEVNRRLNSIEAQILWVRTNAEVVPRPLNSLTPRGAQERAVLGDASADARSLALAGRGSLWVDDLGLRFIGDGEAPPPGFSSLALLEFAHARNRLNGVQFAEAVSKLILLNHNFVALNDEVIFNLLRTHSFEITPDVDRAIACLTAADVAIDGAVGVVVRLLKRLSLERAAALTLRPVTASCVAHLLEGRRTGPTLDLLNAVLNHHLELLPLALDAIRDVIRRVVSSRRAAE